MEWKYVKDEIPPLNEYVLLSRKKGYIQVNSCGCKYAVVLIDRPFNKDKKYNENYYIYRAGNHDWNEIHQEDMWIEIKEPEKQ